jgi:hypothetical protein
MSRVIVWFSRGAASAIAAKLAVAEYPPATWGKRLIIAYCDTSKSENEDGNRFQSQIERWIDYPITTITSEKYATVDEVFEQRRYMSGPHGAICTTEMKKVPRLKFQEADDLHLFGYTLDEDHRIGEFEKHNPELLLRWILRERFVRKKDCYRILQSAGIELPEMYRLGFEHNNCWGCVKSASPAYWNRTRQYNPEVFERRAKQSRDIGARLVKVNGERVFLDELNPTYGLDQPDGDIECGPFCQQETLF